MRNFRKLVIWEKAVLLAKNIYVITKEFPDTEKYGLCTQLQRAAVSVASNIAEGSARNSEIDFARYLEIALGSLFEVETQLIIAKEIGILKEDVLSPVMEEVHVLQRQINQLKFKIKKPTAKSQ